MDDLISRQALYEKTAEWEAQALHMVEVTMNDEDKTEWRKWSTVLKERSAFKFDVADAPSAQKWIPCTKELPKRGVSVLISHVGFVSEDYLDIDDGEMYFWINGLNLEEERQNIAWMPLPEPWRGEQNG